MWHYKISSPREFSLQSAAVVQWFQSCLYQCSELLTFGYIHTYIHLFESDIKSIRKRTDRKKDRNNKEISNETRLLRLAHGHGQQGLCCYSRCFWFTVLQIMTYFELMCNDFIPCCGLHTKLSYRRETGVSYACLSRTSRLANWLCNSLNTADVVLAKIVLTLSANKVSNIRIRWCFLTCTSNIHSYVVQGHLSLCH